MPGSISRAQFLRGDFSGRRMAIRPPWALPAGEFMARCTGCGDCRAACPQGIIQSGPGGYPSVDFSRGGCDFCGACAAACTPGALRRESGPAGADPWPLRARIDAVCLSLQGVFCRICADHCEARAIRFRPSLGGRAQPRIDMQACTGCGACYSPCPSHAIAIAAGAGSPAA